MYQVGIYSEDRAVLNIFENLIINKKLLKLYRYSSEYEIKMELVNGGVASDILVIDIQGNWERISLARDIQEKDSHVKIIFIAESTEDVSDIFEAEPIYLLLKPIVSKKLYSAVDKAVAKLKEREKQELELRFKDRIIRIPYQDILYVESDRRYLIIYQTFGMDRVMMKMSEILEMLPGYFVRCHQSYTVNIHKIIKFHKNEIVMEGGKCLAVSRRRFQETKRAVEFFYRK